MRAVLDRPHRCNFVSVSTAVNRVAKLTAARRRGGGLKGEEEPKYLGILLKVSVGSDARWPTTAVKMVFCGGPSRRRWHVLPSERCRAT